MSSEMRPILLPGVLFSKTPGRSRQRVGLCPSRALPLRPSISILLVGLSSGSGFHNRSFDRSAPFIRS